MFISCDDIYCSQWLITNETRNILKNCIYPTYFTGIHFLLHIKDSIHYNALKLNNFEIYNNLIISTKQLEHSVESFKKLYNEFDYKQMRKIEIKYNSNINKYVISDGVHRLSILVFKDLLENNKISEKYLNIN